MNHVPDYALKVARILQQETPDLSGIETWPKPWDELARIGVEALNNGCDPRQAIESAIYQRNGDGQEIRATLYRAAEQVFSEPPLEPAPVEEAPDCPPLPKGVQPDPQMGAGSAQWVDLYVDSAMAISPMTPRFFHESAALWLGGVAIARRLIVSMPFGNVYPNQFICWLAPTTLYRKSTALVIVRDLARQAFPFLLTSQDTTPEACLSDLAGREPPLFNALTERDRDDWTKGRHYAAQKGWLLDEMSGLMVGAGRDYNAGLVESLLRFYDCDPYYARSTRGQGLVVVRNASLSLLGASTPAAMGQHLTAERLWSMGWWPRFALLTPENQKPSWQEATKQELPPELAQGLTHLFSRLPQATWPNPPETRTVILGAGVLDTWKVYNKAMAFELLLSEDVDPRLHGTYGRLPAQAIKVALILAAQDPSSWHDGNVPTIELGHLARAISTCETWRASAHRAVAQTAKREDDKILERVQRQIAKHGPQGVTLRDLVKAMKDKKSSEIEQAVERGIKLGDLQVVDWQNSNGGPKTKHYKLSW